ncbi:MAG: phage integrase N-terminal SAM-like domain-containing protein [Akkermansiaceae bacterium]|nr:phage integrase N-terminal SAM-like domain-containing protein [Verrucomicrobiales bacterium]
MTPDWKERFLTVVRRRHYSYRTEQSYGVWIERFAREAKTARLEELGEPEIKGFLDAMAIISKTGRHIPHAKGAKGAKWVSSRSSILHPLPSILPKAPIWLVPD